MFLANKLNKGAGLPAPVDPQFNYVTMLLHGDGTNGAQNNTFLDSSTNNFTITRNGNTTQGSFSPYGPNWSNFFNGSTGYLTTPNNTNWVLGTAYTIEAWVNFSDLSGQDIICGSNSRWWLSRSLTDTGVDSGKFGFSTNSGTWSAISSTTTPVVGVWYHVAVTVSSGTISLYVNGALEATASRTIPTDNSDLLDIGTWNGGVSTYATNGYISNLRLVKGSVLYTGSSFTPPTTPLTALTNTVLLTCQSNRFIDNSTNNYAITANGGVSVQRFSPFAPPAAYSPATIGGSGFFDGNRDYLAAPQSAVFAFDTGDFTIEHWVYGGTQIDAFPRTIAIGPGFSTGSVGLTFDDDDFPGKICFYARDITTSRLLVSTTNVNDNAWHHIAVTRAIGIFRLYVDGVLQATNNSFPSSSVGSGSQPCIIGGVVSEISGEDLVGYLSDVRIVKGSVVYTGNFTPPTAPVTAVTNTSLLLNYTNGAIFDNAMMNDLETVGNAQISTSVVKYGTGSMAFDGAGDYLVSPPSASNILGGGDFTLEFFAYPSNTSAAYRALVGSENYNAVAGGWTIYQNGTAIEVWLTGAQLINATSVLSATTWQHIALCRSGATVRLFVNGSSVASPTNSETWTGQRIFIGDNNISGADYFFDGYMDELRITKGVARYTANFTPPTAAFPDN